MNRLLQALGLMRVSEHEAKVKTLEEVLSNIDDDFGKMESERDQLSDKFKKAITDLEQQVELNAQLHELADGRAGKILDLSAEIADLRPDAEAMRRKRERDRNRRKGKVS